MKHKLLKTNNSVSCLTFFIHFFYFVSSYPCVHNLESVHTLNCSKVSLTSFITCFWSNEYWPIDLEENQRSACFWLLIYFVEQALSTPWHIFFVYFSTWRHTCITSVNELAVDVNTFRLVIKHIYWFRLQQELNSIVISNCGRQLTCIGLGDRLVTEPHQPFT